MNDFSAPRVPVPDGNWLIHIDDDNVVTIPPGVICRLHWEDGEVAFEASHPDGRYVSGIWHQRDES